MQRCQYCGFELPENARFCGNCGRTPAYNPALSGTSSPPLSMPQAFVPPSPGNRPGAEDEEERRRGGVLPLPIPPMPDGSAVGGQVPQMQGTPSFSNVPAIQGTSPSMAGSLPPSTPYPVGAAASAPPPSAYPAGSAASAPPGASPAGQVRTFEQQMPGGTNTPVAHHEGSTGPLKLHEQEHEGKKHHKRHREPRKHRGEHAARSGSKIAAGGATKLILIAIIALLVVGGASALVFALRSQAPGATGTTSLTTGRATPTSSNRNASATACAKSGVPCTGTVTSSPTVASNQPSGNFSFTGAIPGKMAITTLPVCGVRNGDYSMQVIGTIGGTQYRFLIGILSYHGPGTYTSNLTVNLIKPGTIVSMDNDGRLPVTITVANNGKAGTVSSDLIGILDPRQTQPSTGHVSGSWTCA